MYQNNVMGDDESSSSSSISNQNNSPTRPTTYSRRDSGSSISNGSDDSDDDSELASMPQHQDQYQQQHQQFMSQPTNSQQTIDSDDDNSIDNDDDDDDDNENEYESNEDESSGGEQLQYNENLTSFTSTHRGSSANRFGMEDNNLSSVSQPNVYESDSEEEDGDGDRDGDDDDDSSGNNDNNHHYDEPFPPSSLQTSTTQYEDEIDNDDADSDADADTDDDDGDGNIGTSPTQSPLESAPPLRGKVLREMSPVSQMELIHDGENTDDVDNDDEGGDNEETPQSSRMATVEDLSNIDSVNDGGAIMSDGESSSSDDELLVSHKSKRKKKQVVSSSTLTSSKKKSTLQTSKSTTIKKKTSLSSSKKKRKKSALIKNELEDEEVTAAVVIDDELNSDSDTSEVVVVAEVIPKRKRKKPEPNPKRSSKGAMSSSSSRNRMVGSSSSSKNKKTKKRKCSISEESGSSSSSSSAQNALPSTSIIPHDKLQAAEQARDILIHSVQRTPIDISDTYTVRNFGRIKIEDSALGLQTMYSNANSLHPVGFSCDRYEFSPVHGRVIKMRCDIVDGSKVRKRSNNRNKGSKNSVHKGDGEDIHITKEVKVEDGWTDDDQQMTIDEGDAHEGPIFRIMWGIGVDQSHDARSFPFDLYSASTPLGGEVDAVAVPLGQDTVNVAPEPGMRVKVRFDSDLWYGGSIRKVHLKDDESTERKNTRSEGKKKKNRYKIQILYDDGGKEDSTFPDPDVVLLAPGCEETADGCILNVTEIKGKAVKTVTGRTPLEAWGQALIQLGLIDEIMLEMAEESVASARLEGLAEVKEKMEAVKKQRQEARARHIQRQKEKSKEESARSIIVRVKNGEAIEPDDFESSCDEAEKDDSRMEDSKENEPPAARERDLRERVAELRELYDTRLTKSRSVAIGLADARISSLGPFLSNPFYEVDDSLERMKNWLATVVRKEKSKMGSTGNRRKIVTATDLLERNTTFLNTNVERLVEGLPGTEFCPRYVFHELRGNGAYSANQSWVHEEQLRQERDQQKKQKRAHEDEAKASYEREKELKRKTREDERNSRKKQRLEELEEKKKAREEDRLSRLSLQVDERLFKEACFQRERVVLLASKIIGKEFIRRRKAAEVIAAYVVESTPELDDSIDNYLGNKELPPISKGYNVDVLRVWNFIHSYRRAFEVLGNLKSLPSLDALQNAIDTIGTKSSEEESRTKAIDLLTNIAIGLCKPISVAVIKTLSSVLTTALQESNTNKTTASDQERNMNDDDPDYYPVNIFTWREVARLVLLNDALNELGYSKQEQAHLLRGFRSGGHPNSKEAKRLRRGEDYALVLRKQALSEMANNAVPTSSNDRNSRGLRSIINTPCKPSANPGNWIYFLHNIKSLPTITASGLKSNIRKARNLLKETNMKEKKKESISTELQRNVLILEQIGTSLISSADIANACNRVRQSVLRILDKATGETYSTNVASEPVYRDKPLDKSDEKGQNELDKKYIPTIYKENRKHGGILKSLICTEEDYKKCIQEKEEYMATAIKFIGDQERKKKRASGDDDEDEDDDEEEDEDEDEKEKKDEQAEEISEEYPSTISKDGIDATPTDVAGKIGKETIYDEFCGDEPRAPDLIRRCLAVLRTLCLSSPAEAFINPVDPQKNQKYYEAIVRPISLYDVGKFLQGAGRRLTGMHIVEMEVEDIVAKFGRDVRLICQNCTCFSNIGGAIISAAEEMLRIFERLLFDWVLCPRDMLPALDALNDDKCIDHHPSDEGSVMLLCDGCDGKYNMSRLKPPLLSVPQGDWYCPRCLGGRCWATVDPRIGRTVGKVLPAQDSLKISGTVKTFGVITACKVSMPESGNTLTYDVRYENGTEENWSLEDIDSVLKELGNPVDSIQCLAAVTESPGYGCGNENGIISEVVPNPLNPSISDAAAQKAVSSTVYQDTIVSSAGLLVTDANGMSASEWLRLLVLLVMKCITSDPLQAVVSKLENEANIKVAGISSEAAQIKSVLEILPNVTDDEDEGNLKGESSPEADDTKSPSIDVRPVHDTPQIKSDSDEDEEQEWNESNDKLNIPIIQKGLGGKEDWDDRNKTSCNDAVKSKIQLNLAVPNEGTGNNSIGKNNAGAFVVKISGIKNEQELQPNSVLSVKDLEKKEWFEALAAKRLRQKAREDSYLSLCIKSQTKHIVASFEEDHVTQVVDTSLTSKVDGVGLVSCQCPGLKCDLCGLPDVALGTPLVRTPNQKEWFEMMQYFCKNRRCQLVAEIDLHPTLKKEESKSMVISTKSDGIKKKINENKAACKPEEVLSSEMLTDMNEPFQRSEEEPNSTRKIIEEDGSISKMGKKIVLVSVSVEGKLVSTIVDDPEKYSSIGNAGMVEFLPRNEDGFQHEMRAKLPNQLPFITGSMSAHECCALAAHRARIDKLVQVRKDRMNESAEKEYGASCGRTLSIGKDNFGRSYWKFDLDPHSLFILDHRADGIQIFQRFSEPESIASVIVYLKKREPVNEIRRSFPKSVALLVKRKWADLLQMKHFNGKIRHENGMQMDGKKDPVTPFDSLDSHEDIEDLDPYLEGEDVLVESSSTVKLLWNANIIAVAKSRKTTKIIGYRVHYKEWSSRFDEWVDAIRVVEPSDNNLIVQEERLEEAIAGRLAVPESLKHLQAKSFLEKPNRVIGSSALPNFDQVAMVRPGATSEEKMLATLKAAILLVEAALPLGSIQPTEDYIWNAITSSCWRSMVTKADSPGSLVGCLILLENIISTDWLRPNSEHLLSSLPRPWKAVNEASVSSIALRLWILDHGIKYGLVVG